MVSVCFSDKDMEGGKSELVTNFQEFKVLQQLFQQEFFIVKKIPVEACIV